MFFSAAFYFAAVAAFGKPAVGSGLNNRIINGTDAAVGQFPYFVSLIDYGEYRCGGTILTHRHVITAAHCATVGFDVIRVAVTTLSSEPKVYYNVSAVHVHPQFHYNSLTNDVAIVTVSSQIKFNELVQPISMETTHVGAGVVALTSGFGTLELWGARPDRLQYLSVRTLDNAECELRPAPHGYKVKKGMICAWSRDQEGLCHGDSGGPLVANGKLIGVVSWAMKLCAEGEPDVYARVEWYIGWINHIIQSSVNERNTNIS